MVPKEIYVLMQPAAKSAYWFENTLNGIIKGANRYGETILCVHDNDLPALKTGSSVLVVGNDTAWMRCSIMNLRKYNLHPILASASMLKLPFQHYNGVMFELAGAIESLVRYLLSTGRKKITLLGLVPNSLEYKEKSNAFRACTQDYAEGEFRVEKCYTTLLLDCIEQYLNHLSFDGTEAAMCANDTTALCLMLAAMKRGISLPESLYITGMGNSYLGQYFKIPLTSISFDYHELGYAAVNLLHVQSRFSDENHIFVSLPCGLVPRASTGNAKYVCEFDADDLDSLPVSKPDGKNESQYIRQIESIFQECDAADREILVGISQDKNSNQLAEELHFSERAIRYRIVKLYQRYGEQLSDELCRSILRMISI